MRVDAQESEPRTKIARDGLSVGGERKSRASNGGERARGGEAAFGVGRGLEGSPSFRAVT